MSKIIKVALAGAGAFGIKHLDGIKNIDGVEVVSLISRDLDKTREVANKYGIQHVTTDLARLRDDSRALIDIVGDLLEAAGGDPAGPAVVPEPVRLDDVVADVLRSMSVLTDERDVALLRDPQPD